MQHSSKKFNFAAKSFNFCCKIFNFQDRIALIFKIGFLNFQFNFDRALALRCSSGRHHGRDHRAAVDRRAGVDEAVGHHLHAVPHEGVDLIAPRESDPLVL